LAKLSFPQSCANKKNFFHLKTVRVIAKKRKFLPDRGSDRGGGDDEVPNESKKLNKLFWLNSESSDLKYTFIYVILRIDYFRLNDHRFRWFYVDYVISR